MLNKIKHFVGFGFKCTFYLFYSFICSAQYSLISIFTEKKTLYMFHFIQTIYVEIPELTDFIILKSSLK